MKRSIFALSIALLIHIFLISLYLYIDSNLKKINHKQTQHKIKISLKEKIKKHKESGSIKKKKEIKTPMAPPMPKGSQLKKIVKKTIQKKQITKKSKTKLKAKPKNKISTFKDLKKQIFTKKIAPIIIPKKQPPKKIKSNSMSWLYEDKSSQTIKENKLKSTTSNSINQDIRKLYGNVFGKLTKGQQEYILDNQEIMRRITQEVLNRQASVANLSQLNINTNNVVEFYLHPNGDMSDFRFLKGSKYFLLDDITKSTIEFAYSKYPLPKEKTLIRYNVFYNLKRY